MTHTGSPKKVFFTPNDVEIYDILNCRFIDKGFLDHSSKVYKFSHFMPFALLLMKLAIFGMLGERVNHERTYAPLELIHSDIIGPFHHMSMSQSKYVLTFIDEFSRYYWAYFLKHKYEFFDLFKVFKALVENQSGRNIKILKSDNGGECVNSNCIQYCEYV